MDEQEKKAEEQTAKEIAAKEAVQGTDDSKDRSKSKAEKKEEKPSMIDGAVLAAEELKKQNDRKERLLNREEQLEAHRILGGRAEAGHQVTSDVETDEAYAEKVKRGEANPLKDDGFI